MASLRSRPWLCLLPHFFILEEETDWILEASALLLLLTSSGNAGTYLGSSWEAVGCFSYSLDNKSRETGE